MCDQLSFRSAEADDFEAVLNLASQLAFHVETTAPPLTFDAYKTFYLGPRAPMHLLLAIHGGQVVGMISWVLTHELNSAHVRVYISDLAIHRHARGLGIGSRLVSQVKTWAKDHGAQKLGWEVWHRNTTAQAFYKKTGAVVDQEAIPYVMWLR